MATELHECEIWLLCDENGNYVVAASPDSLAEKYDDDVGGGPELARRVVQVKVKVPVPSYVTLTGTAPAEGEASLEVS